MKKLLLSILFIALLVAGCSSDSDNQNNPVIACTSPANFSLVQDEDKLTISFVGTASEYQLAYTQNGGVPESGDLKYFDTPTVEFSINDDLALEQGTTYQFYVRSLCGFPNSGAWTGPVPFTYLPYCGTPTNLNVTNNANGPLFAWSAQSNNSTFEVEYGPAGFAIGNGTKTNVGAANSYNSFAVMANTEYDFYVRSYCNGSLGWGDWAGPYTYLAPVNANLCQQPTGLSFSYEGADDIKFQWNHNGIDFFEYALLSPGQSIATASLETINTAGWPVYLNLPGSQYTFYVRGVCGGGLRTAWSTLIVNL